MRATIFQEVRVKIALLRGTMAVVVTGALYVAYLWASGSEVQGYMVVIIVAVPALLTAHRIFGTRSQRAQ